jgi:hypothetical protein
LLALVVLALLPVVASAQPPRQTDSPLPTPAFPPWCEDVNGVQPCLPWRPTPMPLQTPEAPPSSFERHRIYLPLVMGN